MTKERIIKRVWGHDWQWHEKTRNVREHWESTSGNLVMIFPPSDLITSWWYRVGGREHEIAGEDAEDRAFCIGEGMTRQKY